LVISKNTNDTGNSQNSKIELKCGIIMPIAPMNDYTEDHWQDVKSIIVEATQQVDGFKFLTEIVSNSDGEINIIHKNIISNIYNSHIVVCDISGRNPNVLFELGMRLTFDKPTIIIKDDDTPYIFDTSSIETITYPRDLRFGSIVSFKNELAKRIKLTYQKSIADADYSPFLGNFGEFKVPALHQVPVSDVQQLILDEITNVRREVNSIKKETNNYRNINENLGHLDKIKDLVEIYLSHTNGERPKEVIENSEFHTFLNNNGVNLTVNNLKYINKLLKQ